eukprot:12012965-Ditylum_brightwellii.AAC.1
MKSSKERGTLNPGQVGGHAAVCYDRIIPNIANLIGRKKGLTQNLTFVHAQTLEETKFKLKRALG